MRQHTTFAAIYRRPTRELQPLELEELVEGERRYKPEPGEDDKLEMTPSPTAPLRAQKRTLRMRVMNFRALARPANG